MLSAQMIPEFSDKSPEGVRKWWGAMLGKGLYIHPEDDPATITDADSGERILDNSACRKIEAIYAEMFESVGETQSYDIGITAWYNYQGYKWDEERDEFVVKS